MSKTSEEAADFLFPLTRYTRTDTVTAELTQMSHLTQQQLLARVKEKPRDRWLTRETLVAIVRGLERAGDRVAADAVLTALIDHLRPDLEARAKAWRTLSPVDFSDAEDEAVAKLMACARSTDIQEEFWECNFAHCFKYRIDDVFKRTAARRKDTLSLTSEWADGTERSHLDILPDPDSEAGFDEVETRETIQALSREVPRFAEYLYLHGQGYTDREIAVKMDVSDRTLRNWKHKAESVWNTLRPQP